MEAGDKMTTKELNLFLKEVDIYTTPFRELKNKISKFEEVLSQTPLKLLNEEQNDLIIGSTLGDANIRQRNKNCSLRVGHTKKQERYLLWKYFLIEDFTSIEPKWNERKTNKGLIKSLDFSTFTHRVFNFYHKLFYIYFLKY